MSSGRFSRAYVAAAVIALNVVALLVVLNLAAAAYFAVKDRVRPGNPAVAHARTYGITLETLGSVYPGLSATEIGEIFRESWLDNRMVYEPFTLFREAPRQGKYVNVQPAGFRTSDGQGPWPPDRARFTTIFVFGGSTTFGYGVQDGQTVVSHLQRLAGDAASSPRPVRFYNFGRGYYYLSQERILLQQLLSAGVVPDAAVFIDGLNDFTFPLEPSGTARYRQATTGGGRSFGEHLKSAILTLPLIKLGSRVIEKVSGPPKEAETVAPAGETDADRARLAQSVIARYLEDKKLIEAIASAHGIQTFFVWQPVPMFKYDLRYHLFAPGGVMSGPELPRLGYQAMDRARPADANFIWCADIQSGLTEPLYVDPFHYSGPMNARLARCIAAGMKY